MTPSRTTIAIAAFLSIAAPGYAQHIESAGEELPLALLSHINTDAGELGDATDARAILEATLFKNSPATLDLDEVYCIVHVLKWVESDSEGKGETGEDRKKQPSPGQRWYVYHSGKWTDADFATNNRVFGVKRLWLLFIHLNRPPKGYVSRYQFSVKGKTPAPIANMSGLATLFFNSSKASGVNPHRWGGGAVAIDAVPSDIAIQPIRIDKQETSTSYEKLGDPKVFDNEGNYRYDWSVGVPIKSGKELSVDESTNSVAPAKIDKQRIFALFNVHFQPVDVKSAGLKRIPHLVLGFAVADKPQHKLLIGGGWGPAFANFFAGAYFVKPEVNDADGRRPWDRQFIFGINMTYKGTKKALEADKK
jgi:hypothetical protein